MSDDLIAIAVATSRNSSIVIDIAGFIIGSIAIVIAIAGSIDIIIDLIDIGVVIVVVIASIGVPIGIILFMECITNIESETI